MVLGARRLGTHSLGDSAIADSITDPAIEHFAAVSFTGTGTVTFATTTNAAVAFTGSGTFAAAVTKNVQWTRIKFTGTGSLNVTPPFSGNRRRVIVTDYEGNPVAELENAVVGPVSYELNQPEQWSFTLPPGDPKLEAILDGTITEAQLWLGDRLISWGPMVRPQVSDAATNVSVQGAMWHLGRRHIGKAERDNYVTNGDFEDGLAHWNFQTNEVLLAYNHPGAQASLPAHSIVKTPVLTGNRALSMENFVEGCDAFAVQTFTWEVEPETSPDGDEWQLAGYIYVDSFTAPALEGRGLHLERFSTTQLDPNPEVQAVIPGAALTLDKNFWPINEETPKRVWTRFMIPLTFPVTGEPESIHVRLYAPVGVVYWDRISLTYNERTGFYRVDQATIIANLVDHLQDPAYDKSDVNITHDCQPTGIFRDRVYLHSEHPNGLRSIDEFTALSDGVDISMKYTPTDRILTTHFPQKGKHRPKFALETRRNISSFAWTYDGESASTSVIVLGIGNGSGREEGAAIDTAHFAGLTLEEVFVAPPETKIESLDKIAIERLASTTSPEVLAIKTTPPQGLQADPIKGLAVGDTVPVKINQGAFNISDTYRVMRLTINPDDTIDLVLNKKEITQ